MHATLSNSNVTEIHVCADKALQYMQSRKALTTELHSGNWTQRVLDSRNSEDSIAANTGDDCAKTIRRHGNSPPSLLKNFMSAYSVSSRIFDHRTSATLRGTKAASTRIVIRLLLVPGGMARLHACMRVVNSISFASIYSVGSQGASHSKTSVNLAQNCLHINSLSHECLQSRSSTIFASPNPSQIMRSNGDDDNGPSPPKITMVIQFMLSTWLPRFLIWQFQESAWSWAHREQVGGHHHISQCTRFNFSRK